MPVAIRIGHHKCGTTFFQREVFADHPEIRHLGKPYPKGDPVREMVERIIGTRDYDPDRVRELAERHVLNHDGLTTISDGRLAIMGSSVPVADEVPGRLHDALGPCQIMLTVRDQRKWIDSLYYQFEGTGKAGPDPDEWLDANWNGGYGLRDMLDFAGTADRFARVFGADNVQVQLLERLALDPDEFARDLSGFLGVDLESTAGLVSRKPQNVRASQLFRRVRGRPTVFRVARAIYRGLPPGPVRRFASTVTGHDRPYVPKFSDDRLARVHGVSGVSNRRLAESGVQVAEYGYLM